MSEDSTHQLITIQDASDQLKVCTKTIDNMLKRGQLQRIKVGRATRIPQSSINQFIDDQIGGDR